MCPLAPISNSTPSILTYTPVPQSVTVAPASNITFYTAGGGSILAINGNNTVTGTATLSSFTMDTASNNFKIGGILVDVVSTQTVSGQVLGYNGTYWTAQTVSSGAAAAWTATTDANISFVNESNSGIAAIGIVGLAALNPAAGTGIWTVKTANATLTGNFMSIQNSAGAQLAGITSAGAYVVGNTTYGGAGVIVVGTGTLTLPPNITDTIVTLAATQALSNKTLSGTTTNSGTISGGTFGGTITNSGTISGGTLSGTTLSGTTTNSGTLTGGTLSGTIAGTPTFSGNVNFSGTPVFANATINGTLNGTPSIASPTFTGTITNSGTISGGTLSGNTLSGTVAGTPTWASGQTFPSLNSTVAGSGSATAIGLLLASGTANGQAGVYTGSNHLQLVGFGYGPGNILGITLGFGSGFPAMTTYNTLDDGSGNLSIAGALNHTGAGATYVNANLTAADLFWTDTGAGSVTAMALAKGTFATAAGYTLNCNVFSVTSDSRLKPDFQAYGADPLAELAAVRFGQHRQMANLDGTVVDLGQHRAAVAAETLPETVTGRTPEGVYAVMYPYYAHWLVGVLKALVARVEDLESCLAAKA